MTNVFQQINTFCFFKHEPIFSKMIPNLHGEGELVQRVRSTSESPVYNEEASNCKTTRSSDSLAK